MRRITSSLLLVGAICFALISTIAATRPVAAQDDPCATPQIAPTFATGDTPVESGVATATPEAPPLPCVTPTAAPADPQPVAPAANANTIAALRTKAQSGPVNVIVGFDVGGSFQAEGNLSAAAAMSQRARINRDRNALLGRLASVTNQVVDVDPVSQTWVIPYLAATVDAAGLNTLLSLTQVSSVVENGRNKHHMADANRIIGANHAWAAGYDGTNYTVAVLDTGLARDHAFLNGKVVAEACFSSRVYEPYFAAYSIPLCPNAQEAQFGIGASGNTRCIALGVDCTHGLHVSGTVAGRYRQFSGVARGATLIGVQVFTGYSGETEPGAYDSDILNGMNQVYAWRNQFNIAAINMSLGGSTYSGQCDNAFPAYTSIINTLLSANIATVIATGNNGTKNSISTPACISSAISVGATTKTDVLASFSNNNAFVDLYAPGSDILSSVYPTPSYNGYWDSYSGTSMATPGVAGAFAVMRQRFPTLNVAQILTRLHQTGRAIPDTRTGTFNHTHNRINLDLALELTRYNVNDSINQPIVIPGYFPEVGSYTTTQAVIAATTNSNEPSACATYGNSVWYQWTPNQTGFVTISTHGSTYDTVLNVVRWTGSSWGIIACNDEASIAPANPTPTNDESNSYYHSSQVSFNATGGHIYMIMVGRYGSSLTNQNDMLRLNLGFQSPLRSTVGIYNGTSFFMSERNAQVGAGGSLPYANWQAVTGDWDGNGTETIGAYYNGFWMLSNDNATYTQYQYGIGLGTQWLPLVGDWDGNGRDTIGLYYNGEFILSNDNRTVGNYHYFGAGNFVPLAGDWNADGIDTIGIWANKQFLLTNTNSSTSYSTINYGQALNGWYPLIGDWNGDGIDTVGLHNQTSGGWILSDTNLTTQHEFYWNTYGFRPLAGNWNGDYR